MTEKEKIAARIRALLSKTTDNGCSEDEAIAAALKAKQLMDKHEIDLSEAELLADGYEQVDMEQPRSESWVVQEIMIGGIAAFTETRAWREDRKYSEHFARFFGVKGDVIFATWLTKALENFVVRAADNYMLNLDVNVRRKGRRGKKDFRQDDLFGGRDDGSAETLSYAELMRKRASFMVGAAEKIRVRLWEEVRKRAEERAQGQGAGLIKLDKKALITQELASRGVILTKYKRGHNPADPEAMNAGSEHGNKATFNRPVNEGAGVQQITA